MGPADRTVPEERLATKGELFRLAMRERHDPDPYYRRLAARTVAELPVAVDGQRVLDLGCGQGFDAKALQVAGAHIVAMDLEPGLAAETAHRGVSAIAADALRTPFPDGTFDVVYCSNIVEHVPSVPPLLDEIARLLAPGGTAWVSWTNWYSPWGGHHIIPFHLLGPRVGPRLHERLRGRPPKNVPGEGLFATYVGRTQTMVREHPRLELVDAMPRYYPSQRWIVRVPVLREVATWNCVLVVRRSP